MQESEADITHVPVRGDTSKVLPQDVFVSLFTLFTLQFCPPLLCMLKVFDLVSMRKETLWL